MDELSLVVYVCVILGTIFILLCSALAISSAAMPPRPARPKNLQQRNPIANH